MSCADTESRASWSYCCESSALFGGGGTGRNDYSAVVDAYNASLTRTTPTALSEERSNLAGASVGNYALFGGGYTYGYSAVVDAYNASLTRTTPKALSTARRKLAGASVGLSYALFGGGETSGNNLSAVVDAYNASLTRTKPKAMSEERSNLAGASVGNYALFGGGGTGSYSYSAVVYAYNDTPQYVLSINIPPWSKYYIDGVTSAETLTLTNTKISAMAAAPFTGYIKRGFTLSGLIS